MNYNRVSSTDKTNNWNSEWLNKPFDCLIKGSFIHNDPEKIIEKKAKTTNIIFFWIGQN